MSGTFRFRTVVDAPRAPWRIEHNTPILCLGSCFADESSRRLAADGFDVLSNPFGTLYNPLSLLTCIQACVGDTAYTTASLTTGPRGWHCLDYATRFSGNDAEAIVNDLEDTRLKTAKFLAKHPAVIITLGSAFVYELADSGKVVGNCHKFPASTFNRRRISVDEAANAINKIVSLLHNNGIRQIIITVSPIRHLADGLHGNNLSKATLQLAADAVCTNNADTVCYFPAFEAINDDLRDYRFYASDMKHPTDLAADYVYQLLSDTFFDASTRALALECRAKYKASLHRPIL